MTHLCKNANGHLMKNAGGHLMKGCGPPPWWPPGEDWPPENVCNSCSPPLPDHLYVTFADLAGDFADVNGKTTMTWVSGCIWSASIPGWSGLMNLYWLVPLEWNVVMDPRSICQMIWKQDTPDSCDPTGIDAYSISSCADLGCDDGDSCEDSSAATCTVSWS